MTDTQLQTTPVSKRKQTVETGEEKSKSWTRTSFFAFSKNFRHHLSIKSKELIHTSFLLYYIYIFIYIRLWKGREEIGEVQWWGIISKPEGKSCPWAPTGWQPFASLWHSGGACYLELFQKKEALGLQNGSLWTKGTFKGQPLTAGKLYTTAQALLESFTEEGVEQGRGSSCCLFHKLFRFEATVCPFCFCDLRRRQEVWLNTLFTSTRSSQHNLLSSRFRNIWKRLWW